MRKENMKEAVISSLFWKLMERCGTQGIQFVVQIVLARLLLPEDYGMISLIAIFITIANVFVQCGFSTALIQKKNVSEIDFSSVLYLNLCVATILYIALFFISPVIADFYKEPKLVLILRILSITLFFGAINSIQNAIVSRKMKFKKLFFSSLGSIIVSGTVGIILAYTGFGVWALVAQQIVNQCLITIILWVTVKWRPKLMFSFKRVKKLFAYGWKILVSSLIDTFYMNLRSLIIGKIYSPGILGFYNRGDQFPQIIVSNINGSIQSVMLPVLSSQQDDKKQLKKTVRRSIRTSSFILFPMMIGLAIIAEPLVKILLTEKWLPCVPFLQIFCFSYSLWPIHTANLQAINALGRSDIFLKLELIKKTVGLVILLISLQFGIYAIAIGTLINGIISTFINTYPNLKLLNYSYREQWKDIVPSLMLSLFMGLVVYGIKYLQWNDWITVIIQISLGIFVYIFLAQKLKLECYMYITKTFKTTIKDKKVKNEDVL